MTDPVIPQLTPADNNKMALLNSASQPVLGMFFKPFIFEPAKLQPGETGAVAATDTLHPYAYTPIRPYLDTRTFRHRMSSYIVNGFGLTNAANKLVVAPGKMKVFLSAKDTVGDSYIDVDYPGNTIDVSSFGAVPYNFPLPVIAHITTNGVNSLSVTVKVGVLKAEAFTPYKEYITLGTILVSPSNIISIITSGLDWKPSSTKIQDIIAAVSPMQHNIIPVLDDKKFGVKVKLGDHASIYDRSVIPHDENFKHNQWKPASQLRLTVLDSNGGYVNQAIASPTECVNAGKLQDTLRNGSPTGMATGQFALHPLFYTAQVDAHGNPAEGVLYMQLAQTVYNKPIGSQGLFFVEEYMLDESLGNFQRCDVVENTAAFIGFFVCGEGVTTIADCEVIVASDGFSRSFVDPAPSLPEDGVNDSYVTYHDGEYHSDGFTVPPPKAVLGVSSFGNIEPAVDFGSKYKKFKVRFIYGEPNIPTSNADYNDNFQIELYNDKYPDGVSSKVVGSDAYKIKNSLGNNNLFFRYQTFTLPHKNTFSGATNIGNEKWSSIEALGLVADDWSKYIPLFWGIDEATFKADFTDKVMPIYWNFNLEVDGNSQYPFGVSSIPNDSVFKYSFIDQCGMRSSPRSIYPYETKYVSQFGENTADYFMALFKCAYSASEVSGLNSDSPGVFGMTYARLYSGTFQIMATCSSERVSNEFCFAQPIHPFRFLTDNRYATNPNQDRSSDPLAPSYGGSASSAPNDVFDPSSDLLKFIGNVRNDRIGKEPFILPDELKALGLTGLRSPSQENVFKTYVDPLWVIMGTLFKDARGQEKYHAHEIKFSTQSQPGVPFMPVRKFIYEIEGAGIVI